MEKAPTVKITIPIPFGPDRIGTVTLPADMTLAEWSLLDRILCAYRPEKAATLEESMEKGTPTAGS